MRLVHAHGALSNDHISSIPTPSLQATSLIGYVCLVTGLHGSSWLIYLHDSAGYATFSLKRQCQQEHCCVSLLQNISAGTQARTRPLAGQLP